MNRYEVIIYWSEEDGAFVAEVPELIGCAAHGATQEAALSSAEEAIRLWINTAKEFGDPHGPHFGDWQHGVLPLLLASQPRQIEASRRLPRHRSTAQRTGRRVIPQVVRPPRVST